MGDTSGDYRKLLQSLIDMKRQETRQVDMNEVRRDSKELVAAGVAKWGTDESKFHDVFTKRSYAHLRKLFEVIEAETKLTMESMIKKEMSGQLKNTYLALVRNIKNRPGYFAEEIRRAIKGLGTDEHTLNRIVVSRCEVDMKQVKEEFQKLYDKPLEKEVAGDVSADYGRLLAELLKDPSERVYEAGEPEEPHVIEQVEEAPIEETPTLSEANPFDSQSDCERLRKAMKGLGTDEKQIVAILCHRSNKQRQELKVKFMSLLGRDLMKDLHSEISGNFRECVEALMQPQDEFDAQHFRKAVAGLGTDGTCFKTCSLLTPLYSIIYSFSRTLPYRIVDHSHA